MRGAVLRAHPVSYTHLDVYKRQVWTLKTVLINALKLLHPFMPFITEEIFCNLQEEEETIMVSQWPLYRDDWNFKEDHHLFLLPTMFIPLTLPKNDDLKFAYYLSLIHISFHELIAEIFSPLANQFISANKELT